jgi:hypothetical protein
MHDVNGFMHLSYNTYRHVPMFFDVCFVVFSRFCNIYVIFAKFIFSVFLHIYNNAWLLYILACDVIGVVTAHTYRVNITGMNNEKIF